MAPADIGWIEQPVPNRVSEEEFPRVKAELEAQGLKVIVYPPSEYTAPDQDSA